VFSDPPHHFLVDGSSLVDSDHIRETVEVLADVLLPGQWPRFGGRLTA
jgi:hypothetical protein